MLKNLKAFYQDFLMDGIIFPGFFFFFLLPKCGSDSFSFFRKMGFFGFCCRGSRNRFVPFNFLLYTTALRLIHHENPQARLFDIYLLEHVAT